MSNAFSMFQSATIKLTFWYTAILVSISILFSIVIFSIATTEVGTRITTLQQNVHPAYNDKALYYENMRDVQVTEARNNLIGSLIIANVIIWIAAGFGSYYLARRTLRPIEEAHEAQSRFTSDASHELRTPLASMKIELEVALRDKSITEADMHELIVSNLEEVNKLTKLSHVLLQLSRLDNENIDREKVDLLATTKSLIERINRTNARIDFYPSPDSLFVRANTSNVEELLTILIENALKYSPNTSRVNVKIIKQKQLAGFTVSNEGKGIDPTVLPLIFDRFYRADHSRTSGNVKGYGLGLSLAKKIVQLHNGELSVSSAPNATTTFSVLLPLISKNQAENQ